jgi:hypothetical protein
VGTGPVGAPTTAAKPRPSVPGSATTAPTGPVGTDREERIPVAEERLNVGKREVNQGRVRVRSYVVETPVQEQVNLRQEHVSVERRPVDRPVTGKENLFQERTMGGVRRACSGPRLPAGSVRAWTEVLLARAPYVATVLPTRLGGWPVQADAVRPAGTISVCFAPWPLP